jgi:hypothetical protein
MRENLAQAEGQRGTFTATFKRFGSKRGWKFPIKTVLLVNVSDNSGKVTADHLWFTCGKQFKRLNLVEGDRIQFVGRITSYSKGYQGHREYVEDFGDDLPAVQRDFRISFPTQIKNISRGQFQSANSELPLFGTIPQHQPTGESRL